MIQKDMVATIRYTLQGMNGELLDEAASATYIHGHQNILSGMEKALEGKHLGDVIHAQLAPSDAFGDVVEQEPVRVHRREFGNRFDNLYEGLELPVRQKSGEEEERVARGALACRHLFLAL